MPGTVAVNTIRILDVDASDIDDLTRAEMEAHLQIIPLVNMLKEHVPGFQNAFISSVNPVIGVRESRRIMGIKKLTAEDAINGRIPDDSVALFSYFIDIHHGKGEGTYTKSIMEPYGIPYGCTVAKDIDGLMMAGRCISVDAVVFGSSRIMTVLMAVGEATGVGAAHAVKQNNTPKDVDPQQIREITKPRGNLVC